MRAVSTRHTRAGLVLLALVALTVASCERLTGTKISKIVADPVRYEGEDVTVSGTVTERIDIPSVRGFVLSDGKASIGVVTKGNLPVTGAKIKARGRVQQAFAIGARKLLVIIEPPKLRPTPPRNPVVPGGGPT
jgi:hypothetical protein